MTNSAEQRHSDALAYLRSTHHDVEQRIAAARFDRWEAIEAARAADASWSEIGDILGISKQAAQQAHAAFQ